MKINGNTPKFDKQDTAKLGAGNTVTKGADGAYTINLNDKSNKVNISQGLDGYWKVSIDGKQTLKLSAEEMKNLTINGNGGNDTVTVNGDLKTPLRFNGGKGDDTLKLGFNADKNTVVNKDLVAFDPGKGIGERDTFEYYTKGKVTAREGEALPSRVFTKTQEVYQ